MKKSKSIRTKIIIYFTVLMLAIFLGQIIFNMFLLKPCFTYSKKRVIENSFYQLKEDYTGSVSDIDELAETLQNKHSIKIILFNDDEIIYTTGFSNRQTFLPPQGGAPEQNDDFEPESRDDKFDSIREIQIPDGSLFESSPTVSTVSKNINAEQEVQLMGKFDCSGENIYVLMTLPMESIDTSVSLFSRVSAAISLTVLIAGIVIAVVFSKSITSPITSVEQVAQSLSSLDFSKYADEDVSTRELASLAKSINSMSVKLKSSIEELQIANDELKKDIDYKNKIEEMRRQFIANVSHEMKTPLGLLQLYCANLKNNVNGVDKEYYCDVIIEETEKLNSMVVSMLDISSIESGLSKMELAPMDLSAAARATAAKFITGYSDYGFSADIDDEICVEGDEAHLEQAMNNFIANAITHTENGEDIKIILKRENENAVFSVINKGKNIAEEDINNLWLAFYKSDKARTRTANNVGLGLYIVKTIIEKHKGAYGAENLDGAVRFYFTLPLCSRKA